MQTCPKCNMSGIPDDATFCPQCGAELISISDDTIKGTPIKETKKPKEHHYFATFIISFIIGLVVCLLIGDFDNHFHSSYLELFAASAGFAVCLVLLYALITGNIGRHT